MSISKSGLIKQLQLISLLSNSFLYQSSLLTPCHMQKPLARADITVLSLDNSFVFRVHMQNQLKNIVLDEKKVF